MRMIFEEPSTAPLVGLILAVVCFGIQFLLCWKVKRPAVQRIPVYLLAGYGVLVLLIAAGLIGEGGGFVGNLNGIVAAILGIVGAIAAVGILAAWVVYKRYLRKGRNAQ